MQSSIKKPTLKPKIVQPSYKIEKPKEKLIGIIGGEYFPINNLQKQWKYFEKQYAEDIESNTFARVGKNILQYGVVYDKETENIWQTKNFHK